MRFFSVLDFQHLILGLFLGLGAALVLYMSFRGAHFLKKDKDRGEPVDEEPSMPEDRRGPVPAVLVFLYVGFIVWCVFYVIFFGLKGGPL